MEPPPSRFSVIERDGRLIVIDNGEELEPLVTHTHEVMTPAKRRAQDARRASRKDLGGRPVSHQTDRGTINLPIGPGGAAQPVELTAGVIARLVTSFFLVMLVFVFGGVLVIIGLVLAAILLGRGKAGSDAPAKRLLRAWARWIVKPG